MRATRCSDLGRFVVSMVAVSGVVLPVDAVALEGFENRITNPGAVTLTPEPRQQFAIDGNTVVYGGIATGSTLSKVFRYDLATRASSLLCPSGTWQRLPDVSGSRAVFMEPAPVGLAPTQIVLCDVETSARAILYTNIDNFAVAIDGERNMLAAAAELITAGEIQRACAQLTDALDRMDGEPTPPDFATGSAAQTLTQRVAELQASIGCDGTF